MKWFLYSILITSSIIEEIASFSIRHDGDILINRPQFNETTLENSLHLRSKRYLGLSKRFKLNKRYQECVAPGDVKGHCKHVVFCPLAVLKTAKNVLDYLCVIERMHIGVCCPDDIVLSRLVGSQIILDLPGGGNDYDDNNNSTGCGITIESKSNQKAAGPLQQWPWLAAFYNLRPFQQHLEQQFCGGVVITEHHILSAAHCFQDLEAEQIRARLGEYDFSKSTETRTRDYEIETIRNHEDFDKGTYANDISIVKLKSPTSFNSYIWPICLPPVDRNFEGEFGIIAGWGQKIYNGPVSEVLLNVPVPVWQLKQCQDAFLQQITDDNLCAAAYEGGKDSCLGDSGGPLMFQLENGRWITIGVVSWGIGCGNKGNPGIYTKVSSYIPWIIKNTITK